jgi:hypothetical protein
MTGILLAVDGYLVHLSLSGVKDVGSILIILINHMQKYRGVLKWQD